MPAAQNYPEKPEDRVTADEFGKPIDRHPKGSKDVAGVSGQPNSTPHRRPRHNPLKAMKRPVTSSAMVLTTNEVPTTVMPFSIGATGYIAVAHGDKKVELFYKKGKGWQPLPQVYDASSLGKFLGQPGGAGQDQAASIGEALGAKDEVMASFQREHDRMTAFAPSP